jgi:hypothetical protein
LLTQPLFKIRSGFIVAPTKQQPGEFMKFLIAAFALTLTSASFAQSTEQVYECIIANQEVFHTIPAVKKYNNQLFQAIKANATNEAVLVQLQAKYTEFNSTGMDLIATACEGLKAPKK